jgi:hypothetical protein
MNLVSTIEFCSFERFERFNDLDQLRSLLWIIDRQGEPIARVTTPLRKSAWPDIRSWLPLRIAILFEIEQFESLENLRFDSMPILHATIGLGNDLMIALELQLPNQSRHLIGGLRLGNLRCHVFAAWIGYRFIVSDYPLPRAWVNGHGKVIEFVPANGTLDDDGFITSGNWSDAPKMERLAKESTKVAQYVFKKVAKYCD